VLIEVLVAGCMLPVVVLQIHRVGYHVLIEVSLLQVASCWFSSSDHRGYRYLIEAWLLQVAGNDVQSEVWI
jgi:hypothetical protein